MSDDFRGAEIIEDRPTSDRPTTDRPLIWHILRKFQMAISPRGVVRSTSCMFSSTVGFAGSADRMALIPFFDQIQ